jgi:hypothetical protein
MLSVKIFCFTAKVVVCALFLMAGCTQTTNLALKFTPEDMTTYKVITDSQRSIEWMGSKPEKPSDFKGGRTSNRIETTFMQQILSTDDEGNASAKITIKSLKFLREIRDKVTLDFDSSREKDANSPLGKLIGQSYTIEITPDGQVSRLIDASDARTAVMDTTSANQTAIQLLSEDIVKQRHSIPALPPAEMDKLQTGDNWRNIKDFSFGMMGPKSYERIYTLQKIEGTGNHRTAVVQMQANPSVESAKEMHNENQTNPISNMFDNTETYTGTLRLDLNEGKVAEYSEKLQTEWIIVDPNPEEGKVPSALKMKATRYYSMEKID